MLSMSVHSPLSTTRTPNQSFASGDKGPCGL